MSELQSKIDSIVWVAAMEKWTDKDLAVQLIMALRSWQQTQTQEYVPVQA